MFNFQEQVVIGTVLGGSSLAKPPKGKNYYLSMRSNNDLWLSYKMDITPKYYRGVSIQRYKNTFRANTSCLPEMTDIKSLLYDKNERVVKMNILDQMMDIGLAVWFIDGGGRTGRDKKNAYLNVTKFGKESENVVMDYFNSLSIPCSLNKSRNRMRVLFTVSGTVTLFKIIAHRFPPFMYYRLEGI